MRITTPAMIFSIPGKRPVFIGQFHWVITGKQASMLCGGKLPKCGMMRRVAVQDLPTSVTLPPTVSIIEIYQTPVYHRADMSPDWKWCAMIIGDM